MFYNAMKTWRKLIRMHNIIEIQARSDSPKGWTTLLRRRRSPLMGEASDGGSEGMVGAMHASGMRRNAQV